jgi:undecaprenyl diphosphate synthase
VAKPRAPIPAALPRHVAIIMDGNGRWARRRQLPRIAGHRAGVENVRALVRASAELGIEVLTLFAFSSENWRRPRLHDNGVRLRVIGDHSAFPPRLQSSILSAEALTAGNTGLTLVIAANYGGHWDITQATLRIAGELAAGQIRECDVTPERLASCLSLNDLPAPDLFIRSGGEQRISNFLLWQLAYSELYFTDCLWPDFGRPEYEKALASYARRQRRFGMTGEQLEAERGRETAAPIE